MKKWDKLLKNLKSLKKSTTLALRTSKVSYLEKKHLITPKAEGFSWQKIYGNIEFAIFGGIVGLSLYYINKNKKTLSETTRLIAAGIATHIVVDCLTYLGDKINTKVKVEKFVKIIKPLRDVNYFFKKKFSHFEQNKQVKRKRSLKQKNLGHFISEFHFRGIQSAMVFVVINSIFFYGFYKNVKSFLREKFNIHGFANFFISAGIAQGIALIFAFPLESVKTRMQASSFTYDSFYLYYKKLIKGKPLNVIYSNFQNEYSGFFSHLVLYVVYESVTFGIYESMMKIKMFNKNKEEFAQEENEIQSPRNEHQNHHNDHESINFFQVFVASTVSGFISAIITNPIDVYQINKQVNPKFNILQLNRENILTGMKERIIFITFLNLCTFFCLETLGPYYNVRLE
jgi:hypothetical protein